jgi:hypothetical protein
VHELVLVLSDFYVSQETPDRDLPAGVTLPGFQHVARFGTRSKLPSGWRPWLSRWLTGADAGATATVAAASMQTPAAAPSVAPATVGWMATPMHLIAGMTSIHVDRRSILRLDAADQTTLTNDFQRVFHDSGFNLQPLEAGDFLMLGPEMPRRETQEPARALGGSMGQHPDSSIALRRLGAEIEMWLHDHPINDTRRRRGELPVTSLWMWGAGAVTVRGDVGATGCGTSAEHVPASGANAAAEQTAAPDARAGARRFPAGDVGSARSTEADRPATAARASGPLGASDSPSDSLSDSPSDSPSDSSSDSSSAAHGALAYGCDSYLQGLWALHGAKVAPLPQQLDVFGYPHAQRAVLVIEIGVMLQSNPKWTFFEAVADIDRRFVAPAVQALNGGQCQRLIVLANDYELTLRASDRFKFWRRTPPGLSGLQ